MKKVLSVIILFCHVVQGQDTIRTNIVLDSLGNEVLLVQDDHQRPLHYFSSVFTPVCVDGSCYPINIELYWNLAGNYSKYTLKKNEILTKIEHLPFTDFDYGLLHRMIKKTPSALADFTIHELTLPGDDKVDGVTGATRPELAGSFVPDALFTTYTLWHLVRNPKDELKRFTEETYFSKKWTHFIMTKSVVECREAFIENQLVGKTSTEQTDLLFDLIAQYSASFPKNFIQKIDDSESAKKKLVDLYQKDNALKPQILARWKRIGLSSFELMAIAASIGNCSSCFKDELLLLQQFKNWPEEAYILFYAKILDQPNMMRREKMMIVLEERFDSYPKKFRKMIKKQAIN